MFRLTAAAAGVVLLCAAAYVFGGQSGLPAGPEWRLMLLVSMLALLISLVAAVAAVRAARQAARLRRDITLLARSIDVALKDVVARTDKGTASIGEMAASVAHEIDRLSERAAEREPAAAPQPGDNVIPHPSVRRSRGAAPAAEPPAALPDAAAVAVACRKAVAAGEFDIALQPIVSVSRSVAAGFEVFASLPLDSGPRIDIRRLTDPAARAEAAAFERIMLTTALQAGRRRLGTSTVTMPLHVAASEAMLSDGKVLGAVLDMLQFYPDLARTFVLSLPHAVLGADTAHAQAVEMLAAKGVRFAGEGWDEARDGVAPAAGHGVAFVKLSVNRLLDRERSKRKLVPAWSIVEQAAAAKATIIATGVAGDDDAVALMDLGIDLMAGPRFGGPRRLRPEGGGLRPGRLAQDLSGPQNAGMVNRPRS
jgi:EAL domain-containing protein (putative c-di-GMP-specific phosphodiesterase class I)